MKVIVDADSLIYASAASNHTIEDALNHFNESLGYVLDILSNDIKPTNVLICNGSKNCFRTSVNSSYKLNRTQKKPELLSELHELVKKEYNSYWGDGVETDDVVVTLWKDEVDRNGIDSCVIVSNDKDYRQFPCWMFDTYFRRLELSKIGEFEADLNFFTQMIVGDSADNVNYCKGYGKSYAKKIFENVSSRFGLLRKAYYLYLKIYKGEAKVKFLECYNLLKLRTDSGKYIRRYKEEVNIGIN